MVLDKGENESKLGIRDSCLKALGFDFAETGRETSMKDEPRDRWSLLRNAELKMSK